MANSTSESLNISLKTSFRGYVDDLDPVRAWQMLAEQPSVALVDVRTSAEWSYVGIADLSELGKEPLLIEWQVLPELSVNPRFGEQVSEALPDQDAPVIFICRSGARSAAAAAAMTDLGYSQCYNLMGGFEGDPDFDRHRGKMNGWKAAGLPWVQA